MVDIDPPDFGFTMSVPGQTAGSVPYMDLGALTNALEATAPRFAWGARAVCPCTPNEDTSQYDPMCALCRDNPGIIYFGPGTTPFSFGTPLTPIQTAVLGDQALIRGITSGISSVTQLFSTFGQWRSGDCFVTVAAYNQLAAYDRLIALDSQIPWSESILWESGLIKTRYVPTRIQFIRSLTQVFVQGVDYALSDQGELRWLMSPTSPTRISVRYLHHPTWIVVDQPHIDRVMQTRSKAPYKTPAGTPEQFPVRAHLRLEFLTNGTRSANLIEED